MRTKTFLVTLFVLLAGLMLSACVAVSPAVQPQIRSLNVNGSSQVSLTPDVAYISIGVHTENVDAAAAVEANTAAATKVMNTLKAQGIDAKDIRTTNFSIYPQDEWDAEGKKVGSKFVVDNTVYVTLRDLNKVGEVLGASVAAGSNSIYGVQFDVLDKGPALSEGRKAAMENARKQAEELASVAGARLGPVMSISFYNSSPVPLMYDAKAVRAEAGGGGSVPVSAGQMLITVEVNVSYELK